MLSLATRFTACAKKESVFEAYSQFFAGERPQREPNVDFKDATVEFYEDGSILQVKKGTRNNVYTNIPVSLDFEPSQDDVLKLRRSFATMFAGNKEGRKADMCSDALVL